MKQVLLTVIGSFMLYAGTMASGSPSAVSSAAVIIKPAALQCNFAFVRGHRQGNGTALAWGMDGAGAAKFYVSRTYDFDPYDPYAVWEDVTVMNANNSRMYTVSDKSVFPGMIHYRIVAVMTDGSSVSSEIKSIRLNKKR
jgi:hypothetical protein